MGAYRLPWRFRNHTDIAPDKFSTCARSLQPPGQGSQRKAESIHSPETCLPGSGWEFKKAGKAVIPLDAPPGSEPAPEGFNPGVHGATITVNRAVMEKAASKQLAYFWFPQRDRVLTNAWSCGDSHEIMQFGRCDGGCGYKAAGLKAKDWISHRRTQTSADN